MMQSVVAKRYAKAIFEIALEKGKTEQILEELQLVDESFASSSELRNWLINPAVGAEEKKAALARIFQDQSEPVQNLLFLLVDQDRTNLIHEIVNLYRAFHYEQKGMVEAVVTTAFPLSEEEEKQLIETFEQLTQKQLHIKKQVDSDLLGGVVVKIGDRIYDGSLRTKLQQFQKQLKSAKVE